MFRKARLSFIALLSCCTLTCVGFSAWTIGQPTAPVTVSNTIVADNVLVSDNYVWIDESDITMSQYTANGFLTGNSSTSYTGTITATFHVNPKLCSELLGSSATTAVIFKFKDTIGGNNLFSYNSTQNQNAIIYTLQEDPSANLSIDTTAGIERTDHSYIKKLNLTFNDTSATEATFTLIFTLTLTESTYTSYFYNVFNGTENKFAFEIRTTGINES